MKKLLAQYKTWIIGAIIVAAILVLVYFSGRNDKTNYQWEADLEPVDDLIGTDGFSPTFNATNIAITFHGMLGGFFTTSGDFQDACDMLLELSDPELVAVHNAYIEQYGSTIRVRVTDEFVIMPASVQKKDELLARLDALNI